MRWETVLTFWRQCRPRPAACADTLFVWINVIFLSALGIAATVTVATYLLSARMNATKDRELQQVQSEARTQIETARADAAQASARTAGFVRVNPELQLELQTEKDAQQFQPRDMTKEEMAKFVETIKGKVSQLSLIIVLKPPEFLRPSDQPIPSDMDTDNAPRAHGSRTNF